MQEVDKQIQGTLSEAVKLREQWRAEIRFADHVEKPPTLRTFVDSWLRSRALSVKTSTATTYAEALANYVLPYFGDFFVDKITDTDVKDWQLTLRKNLEAGTVNGALIMLRMVLADAVAALITVLKKVGIKRRVSTHGLRRTFNNLSRQVAGEIGTRSITGHVTSAMTEHYSHVGSQKKLAAAGSIVRMVMGTDAEKKAEGKDGGSGGGSEASQPDDTRQVQPNLPN